MHKTKRLYMIPDKLFITIFLMLPWAVSGKAQRLIPIETDSTALVLYVDRNGDVRTVHLG